MAKKRKKQTLDLVGIDYDVRTEKPPGKGFRTIDNEVVGQIDHDSRQICLEGGRSDGDFILFHELVHAAIEATVAPPNTRIAEKYYGEGFVRPFSRFLWSMMRNANLIHKQVSASPKKRQHS